MSSKEPHAKNPANALVVMLIRGRNLPVADRSLTGKGSSDPMVTFRLKGQETSSKVVKKSVNPEWREQISLRADELDDAVEVTVDDWDQISGNDFLGKCWVHARDHSDRKLRRAWYRLVPQKASHNQPDADDAAKAPLGKLELACRWVFLPEFDLPAPEDMRNDEEFPDEPINALHVYLVRGSGLPVMDRDLVGKGGSSDPLVVFTLAEETRNSKVKKKNLEPIWTEYFEFGVEGDLEAQSLDIVCDDWDLASGNDFMGKGNPRRDA